MVTCVLSEVMGYVDSIEDEALRGKVAEFLRDPPSDVDAPYLPLEVCPAGAFQHHSYAGGLLQHTVSVVRVSLTLSDLIEDNYGGSVNRDTVIAGAVLHDIMKVYCYEAGDDGGFRTSEFGGRVDHLSLMVGELMRRGFPLDIVHVVAGHHGDVGPTKPKTLEALVVSLADLVDSELNGRLLRAAEYLLRRVGVPRARFDSGHDAVEVILAKDRGGWDELRRLVEGKG